MLFLFSIPLIFLCCSSWISFSLAQRVLMSQVIAGNLNKGYNGEGLPATASSLMSPYNTWGDTNGVIYIADRSRIRKIVDGIMTTLVGTQFTGYNGDGFLGTNTNLNTVTSVWGDSNGAFIYFSDVSTQKIRKYSISTGIVSNAVGTGGAGLGAENVTGTSCAVSSPYFIYGDSVGNLFYSDQANNRIRKYSILTTLVTTIVGTSGGPGFNFDNKTGTVIMLYSPGGVWGDSNGNIIFSDRYNYRIRQWIRSTQIVITIAGTGSGGFSGDSGPATLAKINVPQGIFVDKMGIIYYLDGGTQRIRYIVNGIINTFLGGGAGSAGDGGPAASAYLSANSVWADSNGRIFISDVSNYKVRDVSGGMINRFAGYGCLSCGGDGGPASLASIDTPADIWGDSNGNIYFTDTNNYRIRMINSSNIITTFGGNGINSWGGTGSSFLQTGLGTVLSIYGDSIGGFYYSGSNVIRKATSSQSIVTTVAGEGGTAETGFNVSAKGARFSTVRGLFVNTLGNIYFADQGYQVVRLYVKQTQRVLVFAGNGTFGFSGDGGPATGARLYTPYETWGDTNGVIFIIDVNNNRIRRVDTSNRITTFAGNGIRGASVAEFVPATSTSIYLPYSLYGDVDGNIYIAESTGARIRMIFTDPVSGNVLIRTLLGKGYAAADYGGLLANTDALSPINALWVDSFMQSIYFVESNANFVRKAFFVSSPTSQPTTQPSSQPTKQPISQPSGQPTAQPSQQPSSQPTCQPTAQPTRQPISHPTAQPSNQPTSQPTSQPVSKPSSQPTAQPSCPPSSQPTRLPSSQPTSQPTVQPSSHPTGQPSSQPTAQPSCQPSSQPTRLPSSQPTSQPTVQPSSHPTGQPSSLPSTTPSLSPTIRPTSQPTSEPTFCPFSHPTSFPSNQPTANPSSVPSLRPSLNPTTNPSTNPSSQPSSSPTQIPSNNPTSFPTNQPSSRPTFTPSTNPSSCPSSIPSGRPSSRPVSCPTSLPSAQPTQVPSSYPTSLPSVSPTIPPTVCPTMRPIGHPSSLPTQPPSSDPTSTPSVRPSKKPTPKPTVRPTLLPTALPTTRPPSFKPTILPTVSLTTTKPPTPSPSRQQTLGSLPQNLTILFNDDQLISSLIDSNNVKIVLLLISPQPSPAMNELFRDVLITTSTLTASVGSNTIILGDSNLPFSITIPTERSTPFDDDYQHFMNSKLVHSFPYGLISDPIGRSLATAGDINKDGIIDIILGDFHSSKVYVFFGNNPPLNRWKSMNQGYTVSSSTRGDSFGWAVTGIGDFNNDNIDDWMSCAILANRCYIIYGQSIGSKDLSVQQLTNALGFTVTSGKVVALGMAITGGGDMNGDGLNDVVISAVSKTFTSMNIVYIVYGGRARLADKGSLDIDSMVLGVDGRKIVAPYQSFAAMSMSLIGDMNGDHIADLAIGSIPFEQGQYLSQVTYVVYGKDNSSIGNSSLLFLSNLQPTEGMLIRGGGWIVCGINDVNLDGYNDLMVANYNSWQGQMGGFVVVNPKGGLITSVPTVQPSLSPTTRQPSLLPTIIATPLPSLQPFLSNVTRSPTITDSATPSQQPTTTTTPTIPPTMIPSLSPTFRQSKVKTIAPTSSPLPTLIPTYRPTRTPSQIPSISPTKTLSPSYMMTRPPSALPTPPLPPSVIISSLISNLTTITEGGMYSTSSQSKCCSSCSFLISTLDAVTIIPPTNDGCQHHYYKVLAVTSSSTPQPQRGTLIIKTFNVQTDVIDLTAFTSLHNLTEVSYSNNPVTLLLSSPSSSSSADITITQEVVLSSLSTFASLTGSNFVFTPSNDDSKGSFQLFTKDLFTAFGFSGALVVLTLLYACSNRIMRRKETKKKEKKMNIIEDDVPRVIESVHSFDDLLNHENAIDTVHRLHHTLVGVECQDGVASVSRDEKEGRSSHLGSRHGGSSHNSRNRRSQNDDSDSSAFNISDGDDSSDFGSFDTFDSFAGE